MKHANKGLRSGFSLLEMIVVVAISGMVMALLLPAIQKARASVARLTCANNLRQIGFALHQYHDSHRGLPEAVTLTGDYWHLSWRVRVMPYLEQEVFWKQVKQQYALNPKPNVEPFHKTAETVFAVFSCPADSRVDNPQKYSEYTVALSSYLAVEGTNLWARDGMMFADTRTRLHEATDGLSNTLLVGERPPSNDFRYGWLYLGIGQGMTGSLDHCLGVREIALPPTGCAPKNYPYQERRLGEKCAFMQFWSLHDGGATFLFADGSCRMLSYSVDPLLPSLATRAGGEISADW